MIKLESHIVPKLETSKRLSDYAVGIFQDKPSRKGIKKAIKKGLVFLDGRIGYTADFVKGEEKIDLYREVTNVNKRKPDIEIKVSYIDPFIVIIDKPAGIVVSGNKDKTLSNYVSYTIDRSPENDALVYPVPVHRLDYPTSGLVIFARTTKALLRLNEMFLQKEITKGYFAITIGSYPDIEIINNDVNGKKAESRCELISSVKSERFGQLNLCKLHPVTGRRHQLRIHMAEAGIPILGDTKYGIEGLILKGKGLYLTAQRIEFIHPVTKKGMDIHIPIHHKFLKIFPDLNLE